MTFALSGKNSIWLTTEASLIDDEHSKAWAEKHITYNPAHKWIVANYAESNNPNQNKHFWSLDDLQFGQPSIAHAPINLLHQPRRIIGHMTTSEMVYPIDASLAESDPNAIANPYIEVLGVLYKHYFPDEMMVLERAHAEGGLTVSMECVGRLMKCDGPNGCEQEFEFKGDRHPSYCQHLNQKTSFSHIIDPLFLAAGVLIPPIKPGWKKASVTQIAELTREYATECELAYAGLAQEFPHLDPAQWESMMFNLIAATTKAPYGNVTYADPGYQADKKKRYPLDTEGHVRAAWSYINMPKNAAKYSSGQVSSIKSKIESAAKKLGIDIKD